MILNRIFFLKLLFLDKIKANYYLLFTKMKSYGLFYTRCASNLSLRNKINKKMDWNFYRNKRFYRNYGIKSSTKKLDLKIKLKSANNKRPSNKIRKNDRNKKNSLFSI